MRIAWQFQAYMLAPSFYMYYMLTMPKLPFWSNVHTSTASFQAYMEKAYSLEVLPKAEYPLYEQGLYGTSPALRHPKHNSSTYDINFEL
jgi:hypothetical protein